MDDRAFLIPRQYPLDLTRRYKNCLEEGVFRTYKPDFVLSHLKTKFGFGTIKQFKHDGTNGFAKIEGNAILIGFFNSKNNRSLIQKEMRACGWFLSCSFEMPHDITDSADEYVIFQFEPTFQSDDITLDTGILYHVTPSVKVGKILKSGLCPRCQNDYLYYPERVYFFLSEDFLQFFPKLARTLYSNWRGADKEYYSNYSLLRIDLSKIGKAITFHTDNNFEIPNGVSLYTTENIPPTAITEIKRISFSDDYSD